MNPVSVSVRYGRYGGYRYRFGIDTGISVTRFHTGFFNVISVSYICMISIPGDYLQIIPFKNRYETDIPIPISPISISSIPNRYRYTQNPPYRTDTDIPNIPHTEPIPIPGSYRFFSYRYQYRVSVPGIGIIPGIGRTLPPTPLPFFLLNRILCILSPIYLGHIVSRIFIWHRVVFEGTQGTWGLFDNVKKLESKGC